jgi:hypothetical protein
MKKAIYKMWTKVLRLEIKKQSKEVQVKRKPREEYGRSKNEES